LELLNRKKKRGSARMPSLHSWGGEGASLGGKKRRQIASTKKKRRDSKWTVDNP